MKTLGSPFLTFFSVYNSNDKLEQRHLVFVFNKITENSEKYSRKLGEKFGKIRKNRKNSEK